MTRGYSDSVVGCPTDVSDEISLRFEAAQDKLAETGINVQGINELVISCNLTSQEFDGIAKSIGFQRSENERINQKTPDFTTRRWAAFLGQKHIGSY